MSADSAAPAASVTPARKPRRAIGRGAVAQICAPLVGRTPEALFAELAVILPKRPDLLEWRVDHFEGVRDAVAVIELASGMREAAGEIPIIFTCRSVNEGGARIPLDEDDIVKLYVAACASRCVDAIDYELGNAPGNITRLREASRAGEVEMILSYHNFTATPGASVLVAKFAEAERLGADVAKVAVMPQTPEDVLTLLGATLRASRERGIPLIGLAMGELGKVSRMFGWVFGSAVTFGVGKGSSAPGQVPLEELRAVLSTARAATGSS